MGRVLLWIVLCGTILAAGAIAAFALWLDRQGDLMDILPAAAVSFTQEPQTGGTITIDGLLTPATASAVERIMKGPPGPVATLRVRSGGGGGNGAERLAQLVNKAGLKLRIEDRAICSSACVIMLGDIDKRLLQIAPGAWLRVHGRSTGPNDPLDRQPSSLMDRWVGQLSPAWLAFLAACPSKPLVRDAGIAMTWAEIKSLERAPASVDCDRIAYRTKDWLFGGMPLVGAAPAVRVVRPGG